MSFIPALKQVPMSKMVTVLTVPVAVVLSGLFVWGASNAAFTGVTSNGPNSWTAGTVSLENDQGSALFSAAGIVPGYSETHCLTVTSSATVDTQLKMYSAAISSDGPADSELLASHLQVEVNEGSGADTTDGGCVGFTPDDSQGSATVFAGPLGAFANSSSYETGVGNYVLPAGGSRQYQVTVSLSPDAPNSLQGTSAGATFMWEAQN